MLTSPATHSTWPRQGVRALTALILTPCPSSRCFQQLLTPRSVLTPQQLGEMRRGARSVRLFVRLVLPLAGMPRVLGSKRARAINVPPAPTCASYADADADASSASSAGIPPRRSTNRTTRRRDLTGAARCTFIAACRRAAASRPCLFITRPCPTSLPVTPGPVHCHSRTTRRMTNLARTNCTRNDEPLLSSPAILLSNLRHQQSHTGQENARRSLVRVLGLWRVSSSLVFA